MFARGRSLAGRAPPLHGGGPGFESPRLHRCDTIRHSVTSELVREVRGCGWTSLAIGDRGNAELRDTVRPGPARDNGTDAGRDGREWSRRRERGRCSRWRRGRSMEQDGRSAKMGARWMPWRWRPRKDAATRRNAPGRRWQPVIRRSPNGATRPGDGRSPASNAGGHRGN